jgi:hypothetical protein
MKETEHYFKKSAIVWNININIITKSNLFRF